MTDQIMDEEIEETLSYSKSSASASTCPAHPYQVVSETSGAMSASVSTPTSRSTPRSGSRRPPSPPVTSPPSPPPHLVQQNNQQNVAYRQQILVQQVDPQLLEAYVQSRIGAVVGEARGVMAAKDQQIESAVVAMSAQQALAEAKQKDTERQAEAAVVALSAQQSFAESQVAVKVAVLEQQALSAKQRAQDEAAMVEHQAALRCSQADEAKHRAENEAAIAKQQASFHCSQAEAAIGLKESELDRVIKEKDEQLKELKARLDAAEATSSSTNTLTKATVQFDDSVNNSGIQRSPKSRKRFRTSRS